MWRSLALQDRLQRADIVASTFKILFRLSMVQPQLLACTPLEIFPLAVHQPRVMVYKLLALQKPLAITAILHLLVVVIAISESTTKAPLSLLILEVFR